MIVAVADTHAGIWYLTDDSRLSDKAGKLMDDAYDNGDQIAISSISFVEMVYLIEKGRIASHLFSDLVATLRDIPPLFVETPVDLQVARSLARIDVKKIPDMPDRIVGATALHLGVPVISRDGKIRLSGLSTIW